MHLQRFSAHRLCYDGPFSNKSCSNTFLSTLSFYEKDAVVGISVLFVRARKRHMAAAGTHHYSLSPGTCPAASPAHRTGTDGRTPPSVRPHRPVPANPTSPAFVSAELNFLVGLKPFRPIRAIRIWDVGRLLGSAGVLYEEGQQAAGGQKYRDVHLAAQKKLPDQKNCLAQLRSTKPWLISSSNLSSGDVHAICRYRATGNNS